MKIPSSLTDSGYWDRVRRSSLRAGAYARGTVSALGAGLLALARKAGALVRRTGVRERGRRAVLALAASSALLAVRVWLVFLALLASRTVRAGQGPSGRLTARGGVVVMFGTCFLGLLIADWANWPELADAVFFMASSLTAYYVRPGSLLPVAVSPPLLFFTAMALEKLVVASGTLAAFEGTLVMLAGAAPWLFAGTALTLAIGFLRGLLREVRTLVGELRGS